MHRFVPTTLLACIALAACTPTQDAPAEAAPTPAQAVVVPAQGGFMALRPTEIDAPGTGAWICTPAGAGQRSRCVPRGVATRPALVPGTATPVTEVIDPPIAGPSTAEALAAARAQQELEMTQP